MSDDTIHTNSCLTRIMAVARASHRLPDLQQALCNATAKAPIQWTQIFHYNTKYLIPLFVTGQIIKAFIRIYKDQNDN